MENIWIVFKANINNYKLISAKDLIRIIKKEQKILDNIFTKNLVVSMKNRITILLSNKKDHIYYQFSLFNQYYIIIFSLFNIYNYLILY